MKIKWNDKDADIGFHEMELELIDGTTRRMSVWDYTCPFQKEKNKNRGWGAIPESIAFKVSYCCGYSMEETFDNSYTLEDVKIWAEDYLLDMLINSYKEVLENLDRIKSMAEWAKQYKEKRKSGGI